MDRNLALVRLQPVGQIWLPVFLKINFYWHTAIPNHLPIVFGCFHAKVAQLNSHRRDHVASITENIYYHAPCTKRVLVPHLKERILEALVCVYIKAACVTPLAYQHVTSHAAPCSVRQFLSQHYV